MFWRKKPTVSPTIQKVIDLLEAREIWDVVEDQFHDLILEAGDIRLTRYDTWAGSVARVVVDGDELPSLSDYDEANLITAMGRWLTWHNEPKIADSKQKEIETAERIERNLDKALYAAFG